ncbi:MAG: HAD hydrolase-like protein [Clostridia bacterium]|nr:HAD hydrolase-like protein [Clostridia bacterium]
MNYLLIWDIDGTLIQGRGLGRKAMEKAFFEIYGIQDALKEIHMSGMLDTVIFENALNHHNIKNQDGTLFYEKYFDYLDKEVKSLTKPIDAPGVLELLIKLQGFKHIYNVLGTGNIEKGARIKLSAHDMNQYFPAGGFSKEEKERWQVIFQAVNNAKKHFDTEFMPENTYVIGDTPKDIDCGKKLGYKTIAVSTGVYSLEELSSCNPDFLFKDLSQSESFLKIFSI